MLLTSQHSIPTVQINSSDAICCHRATRYEVMMSMVTTMSLVMVTSMILVIAMMIIAGAVAARVAVIETSVLGMAMIRKVVI